MPHFSTTGRPSFTCEFTLDSLSKRNQVSLLWELLKEFEIPSTSADQAGYEAYQLACEVILKAANQHWETKPEPL